MNNVTILGRLVRDFTKVATTSGGLAKNTLAINEKYKGKESTQFINIVAFGKTAETLSTYVSKGQRVAIQGRLQSGSYEKDGRTVYTTEVVVDSFTFVEPKAS